MEKSHLSYMSQNDFAYKFTSKNAGFSVSTLDKSVKDYNCSLSWLTIFLIIIIFINDLKY